MADTDINDSLEFTFDVANFRVIAGNVYEKIDKNLLFQRVLNKRVLNNRVFNNCVDPTKKEEQQELLLKAFNAGADISLVLENSYGLESFKIIADKIIADNFFKKIDKNLFLRRVFNNCVDPTKKEEQQELILEAFAEANIPLALANTYGVESFEVLTDNFFEKLDKNLFFQRVLNNRVDPTKKEEQQELLLKVFNAGADISLAVESFKVLADNVFEKIDKNLFFQRVLNNCVDPTKKEEQQELLLKAFNAGADISLALENSYGVESFEVLADNFFEKLDKTLFFRKVLNSGLISSDKEAQEKMEVLKVELLSKSINKENAGQCLKDILEKITSSHVSAGLDKLAIEIINEYGLELPIEVFFLPSAIFQEFVTLSGFQDLDVNKFGVLLLYEAILSLNVEAVKNIVDTKANTDIVIKTPYLDVQIGHCIVAAAIINLFDEEEDDDDKLEYKKILKIMEMLPGAVTSQNYKTLIGDFKKDATKVAGHLVTTMQKFIDEGEEDEEGDVDMLRGLISYFENIFNSPVALPVFKLVEKAFSLIVDYQSMSLPEEVSAAITGDGELLAKTLEKNPDLVNSQYNGMPLIAIVSLFDSPNCIELLKHELLDLNVRDEYGDNVVGIVAPLENIAILEALLARGADIDAQNHHHNTAADKILYHLGRSNYEEAVRIVGQYSKDPMNQLMAGGINNYQFLDGKVHVGIATAAKFWSIEHFSLARHAMKKNKALQVLVFDKDLANEEFLKKFNGFIIPGGGDTYPEDKEFTLDDVPEGSMTEGEKLYKTVLAIADKYSIPLMGMCLGNQYIGLHAGATLNATIGHNGGLHKGLFIKGTMPYFMSLSLYEQNQVLHDYDYPNVEFHIDTAHNFGILGNKPGQLTVGAYSEEGVVQSVSYKNHIIGFQFYPENYYARESSSDFAVRSINLIDNFLSLATQHFQWHDFANGKGFAYQEAQEALQASNQNLMKLINAPLQESSCAPSDILKLSTCNSTRAEFKWPEPALEDFSRNLGESHEVILGEAVEVLG